MTGNFDRMLVVAKHSGELPKCDEGLIRTPHRQDESQSKEGSTRDNSSSCTSRNTHTPTQGMESGGRGGVIVMC